MFACYPSPSPYLPPRVKRSIFPRVSPVSFISHNFSTQRRQLTSIVSPHLTYLGDMIGDALCVSHLVVKWEAKENGGGVVRCSVSVSFSFSRRTDGGGAPFPGRPASAFVTGFFANAVGAYRGASGARRSSVYGQLVCLLCGARPCPGFSLTSRTCTTFDAASCAFPRRELERGGADLNFVAGAAAAIGTDGATKGSTPSSFGREKETRDVTLS